MLRRGTANRSLQQINDELDKLKSTVSIGGGGQTVNVSVVSTRDNLAPTLDIVTDLLRNPVFPEAEFAKLRDETLAGLDQQRSEPQAIAARESARITSPWPADDFRRVRSFEEEAVAIRGTSVADLRRFHLPNRSTSAHRATASTSRGAAAS